MENPIKIDDLGVPLFSETPISSYRPLPLFVFFLSLPFDNFTVKSIRIRTLFVTPIKNGDFPLSC